MRPLHVIALLLLATVARADEPPKVKPKNVPPAMFEQAKIAGDMPHLPDAVKTRSKGATLVWLGKVCVDVDGVVNQALVMSGIPGADDAILAAVRTWRLKPQPIPICTMIRFEFEIAPPPKPAKK